jgi:hypothetical protein
VRQSIAPQVEVSQCGREVAVPEQALEGGQIGAGFEQVRGVTVPQSVDRRRLPHARLPPGLLESPLQGSNVEGLAGWSREQPVRGSLVPPVVTQLLK